MESAANLRRQPASSAGGVGNTGAPGRKYGLSASVINGSQALAVGLRLGHPEGSGPGRADCPKALCGGSIPLSRPESVVIPPCGTAFGATGRPHAPEGCTAIPAAFR